MKEIWKDVPGYFGKYQVSDKGNVKRFTSNGTYKPMSIIGRANGYRQVKLCRNGIYKVYLVHRLVALTFIPNPSNYTEVNHIDGVRHNNSIDNLEWISHRDNIIHSYKYLNRNHGCRHTRVICLDTQEVFYSITEAAKSINVSNSSLSSCIKHGWKAGGMRWQAL